MRYASVERSLFPLHEERVNCSCYTGQTEIQIIQI